MKRIWIFLTLGLLSAGCASPGPADGVRFEVDRERVSAVERAARDAGVQVHWVNYPRKRITQ